MAHLYSTSSLSDSTGKPRVMNLCSVSWEVIRMTSRTIRGLVPNLSGDNRCISSSHLRPPPPPPYPMGSHSPETWPVKCVVMDKVTAQLYVCMYGFWVYVCAFTEIYTTKTKGDIGMELSHLLPPRSHPSEVDLTLEDSCGPVPTLDGSKALLQGSGSRRSGWTNYAYCKVDRWGTQGSLFCPLVMSRHQSLWLPLCLVPSLTVFVTLLSAGKLTSDSSRTFRTTPTLEEDFKSFMEWPGLAGSWLSQIVFSWNLMN